MSRRILEKDFFEREYFEWMYSLMCGGRYDSEHVSYRKLLSYLHSVEFTYILPRDANRAEDGIDLRGYYAYNYSEYGRADAYISGPCSVLEMMIALAFSCEEIMDNPAVGDRTAQWFWGMVVSLGLGSMTDNRFDEYHVERVIERFLNRDYSPDGRGGLFTIPGCREDLRDVEIWYQTTWYLDTIM